MNLFGSLKDLSLLTENLEQAVLSPVVTSLLDSISREWPRLIEWRGQDEERGGEKTERREARGEKVYSPHKDLYYLLSSLK